MNTQPIASVAPNTTNDALRRTLLQELAERETLIHELADRAAPHIDPVAWSTSATAKAVAEQIQSALRRLDAGTYGLCGKCGNAIPAGRLDAVPFAASCLGCQDAADRF
ncbi:TraR/DksA family transcriptional regulator [Mycetocola manganoxydans]|uniref:TraR/DksA family transcriptional regulator n=1 Tax=Mycetocola manganoxydans TaxID=699879 RepID=A0A3L6ZS03_9MICO|nr:TraR/DksA family transcriptional regulator [Mycetocola manganoxydans]RLP70713.1 TraR/DksA family transcriptional regulator [Mycetocola manganoxydans]GHD48737.1 hypothetical protein GCM10008097_21030 [Mycetocola manganoxydans]